MYEKLYFTKNRIIFVLLKNQDDMKKETIKIEVTEIEEDLIIALRNFRKTYPDGYPELLWYAQTLFDKLATPF